MREKIMGRNHAMKKLFWKAYAVYNIYCRFRLFRAVPGLEKIMADYREKTTSTGTKYTTLFHVVRSIQKNKPLFLLECGTGVSTIVICETLKQLEMKSVDYKPNFVSMESVAQWHEMAEKILPTQYNGLVDIRLGERKKFEFSMFRGYVHSNIPKHNFDFIFLDGPNYADEYGSSCCLDFLKVRLSSKAEVIHGVVDTRVSSVFVLQSIFGLSSIKYYTAFRTCTFQIRKIAKQPKLSSEKFKTNLMGRVFVKNNAYTREQ